MDTRFRGYDTCIDTIFIHRGVPLFMVSPLKQPQGKFANLSYAFSSIIKQLGKFGKQTAVCPAPHSEG